MDDYEDIPVYFCRVRNCKNEIEAPKSICINHLEDWIDSPEYPSYCELSKQTFSYEKSWQSKVLWNSWISRASNDTFKEKFERFSDQWHEDTKFLSNLDKIIEHPAYQTIILMGQRIIPLMLKDLEKNGFDHWIYALHKLTGIESDLTDDECNSDNISNWWIEWGLKNGII